MSSIYVKNICAQLPKNTLVEIHRAVDLSHEFDGMVAEIPPELLLLEVVKFQTQNERKLHISEMDVGME